MPTGLNDWWRIRGSEEMLCFSTIAHKASPMNRLWQTQHEWLNPSPAAATTTLFLCMQVSWGYILTSVCRSVNHHTQYFAESNWQKCILFMWVAHLLYLHTLQGVHLFSVGSNHFNFASKMFLLVKPEKTVYLRTTKKTATYTAKSYIYLKDSDFNRLNGSVLYVSLPPHSKCLYSMPKNEFVKTFMWNTIFVSHLICFGSATLFDNIFE